jgi:hypothetical protein
LDHSFGMTPYCAACLTQGCLNCVVVTAFLARVVVVFVVGGRGGVGEGAVGGVVVGSALVVAAVVAFVFVAPVFGVAIAVVAFVFA